MSEIASAYLGIQCFIFWIGVFFLWASRWASDKTLLSGEEGWLAEKYGVWFARRVYMGIAIGFFLLAVFFPLFFKL